MNTKEVLIAARALIADREHWTQGTYARDNVGAPCGALSARAYAFCFDGAVMCSAGSAGNESYIRSSNALAAAAKKLYGVTHIVLNDEGFHEKGLNCFDLAISKVRVT
jgi:hypothetical protein